MKTESLLPELNEAGPSPSTPAPAGAFMLGNQPSLLDFLIVLAERKQIVVGTTAIFAILSIAIAFLQPTRYTATVTLLPPQQNTSMSAALASQLGNLGSMSTLAAGGLGLRNQNEVFVGMLRSRSVEDAMVQHFQLMREYRKRYPSDARKAFERRASVDGGNKDSLIHISVEDRDPQRAAELANGYVDQFRNLSQHLAITEASQRRLFFEQELALAQNNLANAEETLRQTEETTGVIQLDNQARALIDSSASLRAQIAAREVQIQGMRTYATGENAQLVQAQRELESMRAQLAKLGGSEENAGGEMIVPKGRVPQAGLEYVRKLRDVKYNENIFGILARQFEAAKLDEAKQGALIQVVDPAIPPDKRSSPKRRLIVLVATAFGFILGIVFALFQAAFLRLKDDPEATAKLHRFRQALSLRG